MRLVNAFLFGGLACAFAGCTGLAFPSGPGGDGISASLSSGGIAVDPRTETTFVLGRGPVTDAGAGVSNGVVYAISPDSGALTSLADLAGYSEIRVAFPKSSVLVFGQNLAVGSGDRLMRFDESSLTMTTSAQTSAQYWGTRTSPSGQYVAVADNSNPAHPIHLIESDTLAVHVVPSNAGELEAMWLHGSDTLVAAYFTAGADQIGTGRFVGWSIAALEAAGFPTGKDGFWASPTFDVTVPGVGFDLLFSFTWVGISPDDATVVFPVLAQAAPGGAISHELIVLDAATGGTQTVPNAFGPVGFTPDGKTIVSYNYASGSSNSDAGAGSDTSAGTPELLLVNRSTLSVTMAPIPSGDAPTYYVPEEGNQVVVASSLGDQSLVIYDLATHAFEKVGGPSLPLTSFAERSSHDELWLVDNGLFRLTLASAALSQVPLSWTPANIDILPTRDLLVLDDQGSNAIRFYSPQTGSVVRTVTVP